MGLLGGVKHAYFSLSGLVSNGFECLCSRASQTHHGCWESRSYGKWSYYCVWAHILSPWTHLSVSWEAVCSVPTWTLTVTSTQV